MPHYQVLKDGDPNISDSEASFRLMAFYIAYDTLYKHEKDLTLRFANSIIYSSRPLKDTKLIKGWHDWTRNTNIKTMLERKSKVPKLLQPIVSAYLKTLKNRREETNDDLELL